MLPLIFILIFVIVFGLVLNMMVKKVEEDLYTDSKEHRCECHFCRDIRKKLYNEE